MPTRLVAVATYDKKNHRAPWHPQIVELPADADFPRKVIWNCAAHYSAWQEAQEIATSELQRLNLPKISGKNADAKSVPATPKLDPQAKKVYNLDDV